MRGALNSLEDGALVLDADGGVVFMNGPARDLIGFAEDLYSSEFGMALKGDPGACRGHRRGHALRPS
ncbi:MAG: hypothetical protein HND48_08815 [Chloroflexi bacterium]|nr:hypothetical protein [Chloroflexota bacterium]